MTNSLQNKLLHFEAKPPEEAWSKIADALDMQETYTDRLFRYQETPPATGWAAIETALNRSGYPAKVVAFSAYKKPLRYLAAASFIAIILTAAVLYWRQPDRGSQTGTAKSLFPSAKKDDVAARPSPAQTNVAATTLPSLAMLDKAASPRRKLSIAKRILRFIHPQNSWRAMAFTGEFIPKEVTESSLLDFSLLDNFMVYSDNDGNVMKLPKKLFSLVNCQNGDLSCKERVQQLQQKLSASNSSPDFFGMLDQLRQMQ